MIVLNLDDTFNVTIKPNSSLSASGKLRVILLLSIVPCLIGIGFTLIGVWLVLPFVGLELAALAYAFYFINLHENDYESISIDGDKLLVETCYQGVVTKKQLNTYWTKLVKRHSANGELHIGLMSHGKEIVIGKYLTKSQRETVAEQLQKRMSSHKG